MRGVNRLGLHGMSCAAEGGFGAPKELYNLTEDII